MVWYFSSPLTLLTRLDDQMMVPAVLICCCQKWTDILYYLYCINKISQKFYLSWRRLSLKKLSNDYSPLEPFLIPHFCMHAGLKNSVFVTLRKSLQLKTLLFSWSHRSWFCSTASCKNTKTLWKISFTPWTRMGPELSLLKKSSTASKSKVCDLPMWASFER